MAGGKGKKKKWSKGKVKEKAQLAIQFDKGCYDKLMKEIPKAKIITTSIVSERCKVNGSMARQAMKYLERKGLIVPVGEQHHSMPLYTRSVKSD